MTTPDPKANNAPFEWSALTINKVERIQLERLHQEQDRIEREARERDAQDRAAREQAEQDRDREALEHAWFEEGEQGTLEANADPTPPPGARPSETRMKSLPPPKPRGSRAPRRREGKISLGLVLAAAAFGGSVYFSLRWVAEVRQAHVTQQLSSTKNATVPATSAIPGAQPTPTTTAPSPTLAHLPPTVGVSATVLPEPASPSFGPVKQPASAVNQKTTSVAVAAPVVAPKIVPAVASTVESDREPGSDHADAPTVTGPARGRLLVPRAGTPVTQGTRVYRAGD